MKETTVTEEQVRAEHLREVNEGAHWAYLLGVIAVGFAFMVVLIALLGN